MKELWLLVSITLLQLLGLVFFAGQTAFALMGIPVRPVPWQVYELAEITSAAALTLGLGLGAYLLIRTIRQRKRVQRAFSAATKSFHTLMHAKFDEWQLTDAERDVALFAIKGMNLGEIASLRNTSEGTVIAQSASVYRKAGVNSRAQLVSLFIEDMFDSSLVDNANS